MRIVKRPLSEFEHIDLFRRAEEAEEFMRSHWRGIMRRTAWAAVAVAAIYALLWWATFHFHTEVEKTVISTAVSAVVLLGVAAFELWEARARVWAVQRNWEQTVREAEDNDVVELQLEPVQAWAGEGGWLLDLGDGRGLWAEWDLPAGRPTATMAVRVAYSGILWIDQEGEPCPAFPLDLDWRTLPPEHPLTHEWGPAIFRLGLDPVASLVSFKEWSFPLGSEPRHS